MVIEPQLAPERLSVPLPLFESVEIAILTTDDGTLFSLVAGLSEELVAKLKERSLDTSDEALQSSTSDHARFGTGSYEEWYAKGRVPFALVASDGGLATLSWFGPGSPPEEAALDGAYADTVAFRAYPPYRGMRLMKPFGTFVLSWYDASNPGRKLWLETNSDNAAGQALFAKLGFEKVADSKGGKRIVMTRS